jgi:hypothetical protein
MFNPVNDEIERNIINRVLSKIYDQQTVLTFVRGISKTNLHKSSRRLRYLMNDTQIIENIDRTPIGWSCVARLNINFPLIEFDLPLLFVDFNEDLIENLIAVVMGVKKESETLIDVDEYLKNYTNFKC